MIKLDKNGVNSSKYEYLVYPLKGESLDIRGATLLRILGFWMARRGLSKHR